MIKRVKRCMIMVLAFMTIVIPFATIRTANAEIDYVYLGGAPLGIGLAEDGLIITGMVDVITDEGAVCPVRGTEISTNDVIIALNGEPIRNVGDFVSKIQKCDGALTLTVKRGEIEKNIDLSPVTDSLTGLKKLGITVKEGINGIGTLTFVLPGGLHFGALGHAIVDGDTGKSFVCNQGSIYACQINGFKRPENGKAGELTGRFTDRLNPIGKISLCNSFGVYGIASPKMIDGLSKIPLGNRSQVKPGSAFMYTTIAGSTPKCYAIDIVKVANQKKPHEKSMLIRVTDRELLAETGGILQGMSGSPIVQDGRLVGAVTHVLVNDSTLGYGLYIDWMMENAA